MKKALSYGAEKQVLSCEQIEIMKPNGDNVLATVLALVDEDGNEMESCPHPQQVFYVKLSETPDEFDILRRQENEAIALD